MRCHSMSIKSRQLELSASRKAPSSIKEIIEICYLIDVRMCGTFNRPGKTVSKLSRISGQMILVPIWPLQKLVNAMS